MGTGYRPPSREPKGSWARHIHARRREWGWSQTHGFEAVRAQGIGLGEKSRSAYIAIDMGERQPTPDEERVLLAVYGVPADEPDPAPSSEISDLAAAIRELARSIGEERAERLEWERGVLESVRGLAQWLTQRDDPEPVPLADGQGTGRS